MKLLVFTDMHGSKPAYEELKKKAKEVDIIICCGDMSVFEHKIKKIMADLAKLGKPLYIIHGNHEEEEVVEELSNQHNNLHFIHRKIVEVDGISIVGYGGEGFSFETFDFEDFMEENKERILKKAILCTHQPPYETEIDFVWDEHAGNKTFKKYIKHFNYSFSGHIHETAGTVQKIGKTTLANPGPDGMIFEL